jgi:hypothetical protein
MKNERTIYLVIFLLILIIISSSLGWLNRYDVRVHEVNGYKLFVKENRITGNSCTINEGPLVERLGENLEKNGFPKLCK